MRFDGKRIIRRNKKKIRRCYLVDTQLSCHTIPKVHKNSYFAQLVLLNSLLTEALFKVNLYNFWKDKLFLQNRRKKMNE